jgi:hypothetical protein
MSRSYMSPAQKRMQETQKRMQVQNNTFASSSAGTKKKEPQKVFQLDANKELFPTLIETINKSRKEPLNFSSAAAKRIEPPKVVIADVMPGWVHIRRRNGKIEYKYGAPILKPNYEIQEETFLGNILFNYRMKQHQYERDMDVLRLGDLSEYYGEPTLAQIYDDDMFNENKNIEDDESNNSDSYESDNDY